MTPEFLSRQKEFRKGYLPALTALTACLCWSFREILTKGWVYSAGFNLPVKSGIISMYEQAYLAIPPLFNCTQTIKDGVFPSWTSLTQGGTPLLGKLQAGIFAPHQLPYYILPMAWMPYSLTLVLWLKALLIFLAGYTLARVMRLDVWGGILVGILFNYTRLFSDGHYCFWSTVIYFPVLLALVELYFRRRWRFALFLIPWMFAFPFLGVHMETAFRINLMGSFFFLYHLYHAADIDGDEKWKHALGFGAAGAAGLVIASPQILEGMKYVENSYNQVWRTLPEYGWSLLTVHKHLNTADALATLLGLGGLLACFLLLKGLPKGNGGAAWVRTAAAAGALAFGLAVMESVGMDISLDRLATFDRPMDNLAYWLTGFLILFFCFRAFVGKQPSTGVKGLGYIFLFSLVTMHKIPPFSTILSYMPLFKLFNNTLYLPEFDLCRAVLCAIGLRECFALAARPWEQRAAAAKSAAFIVTALVAGYVGAQSLVGLAARNLPMSLMPDQRLQRPAGGGFTTPERITTFRKSHTLTGWIPSYPPVAGVMIGFGEGNKLRNATKADLTSQGARLTFSVDIPLPEMSTMSEAITFAEVIQSDGQRRALRGPTFRLVKRPQLWLLALGALALPLILLVPGRTLFAVHVFIWVLCATYRDFPAIPADQLPVQLPGIAKVKADPDRFRISSFRYDLLTADYPSIYGIDDLRTGGDNLDVLQMQYFQRLARTFLSDPADAQAMESGLRLLGLANVKYLLDTPDSQLTHPGLGPYFADDTLTIYENKFFKPRAQFYEKHAFVRIGDFFDWRNNNSVFGPVAGALRQPGFDIDSTMLLTDTPGPSSGPALGPSQRQAPHVRITAYGNNGATLEVDTPRPGFVMLADNVYPGWAARLNGVDVPILRAWLTFRAVSVPAGRSRIEFGYNPFRLKASVLASVTVIIAWLFMYLGYRMRRPPLDTPPPLKEKPKRKGKKNKKEKDSPLADPLEDVLDTAVSAGATENMVLLLTLPTVAYWTVWSAFIYRGGTLVNAAACVLLAGLPWYAWRLRARTKAVSGPGPEGPAGT